MSRPRSNSMNIMPHGNRPRSNSIDGTMPQASSTAPNRPLTLFFYCTQEDHDDIVRESAIWESPGVRDAIAMPHQAANRAPTVAAAAAAAAAAGNVLPPQDHVGEFPMGAYAAASPPETVKQAHNDFLTQWYGVWRPANPVHFFVEFTITEHWQLHGHNLMAARGNRAPFSWHWVNPYTDTTIQRGPAAMYPRRNAVKIQIVRHGRFIP